MQTGYMICL